MFFCLLFTLTFFVRALLEEIIMVLSGILKIVIIEDASPNVCLVCHYGGTGGERERGGGRRH